MSGELVSSTASMKVNFSAVICSNSGFAINLNARFIANGRGAEGGTYAPLDEVLAADFIEEARRSAELREVMNYVVAAEHALSLIKVKPICLNVLRDLQSILVKGTRGEVYDSGRLRQRQVFIGERELGIEQSRFVPPAWRHPGDWSERLGEVDYRRG
jgi:hypothetical protein